MKNAPTDREQHNSSQKRYFERTVKRTMVPEGTPYLRRHVDEVLKSAELREGDRLLEVGCGMGRHIFLLAEKRVRVEGLDLSAVLLERLRIYSRGRFELPLHCADIEEVKVGLEGAFNVVAGFFMLHHLHDLERGFAAVARYLKPGGKAIFVEPNPFNLLYYAQILITPGMTWQGDKGILNMRRGRIFSAMSRAGFGSLTLTRFGFFPPFLANKLAGARIERLLESVPLWRKLLPLQVFKGVKL